QRPEPASVQPPVNFGLSITGSLYTTISFAYTAAFYGPIVERSIKHLNVNGALGKPNGIRPNCIWIYDSKSRWNKVNTMPVTTRNPFGDSVCCSQLCERIALIEISHVCPRKRRKLLMCTQCWNFESETFIKIPQEWDFKVEF
ncbi:hypothetical protein T265_15755, partial [Opisthorchis viverrini]